MLDAVDVRARPILFSNVADVQSLRHALLKSVANDLESPLRGRGESKQANEVLAAALALDASAQAGSVELLLGILQSPRSGALAVLLESGPDPAAIKSQLGDA
jgi:hypothetical protein